MNIAQFSKISGIAVSTLHYYDKIGLLSPAKNSTNGYRQYNSNQLFDTNNILILKDSGFSLIAIKKLLKENPSPRALTMLLEKNLAALEKEIDDKQQQANRLKTNLFLLKNGGIPMINEIIIKELQPINGISLRRVFSKTDPQQTFDTFSEKLWSDLEQQIKDHEGQLTTPCLTLYYEGLFLKHESAIIDLEIVEPLAKPLKLREQSEVGTITLPAQTVASTLHRGSLSDIGTTYNHMLLWLKENHYRINGPVREIYHQPEKKEGTLSDISITELQIPIVVSPEI